MATFALVFYACDFGSGSAFNSIKNASGDLIGLILSAAGCGFLLGVIHHVVYWKFLATTTPMGWTLDHRPLLSRLQGLPGATMTHQRLEIRNAENQREIEVKDTRLAWLVVTTLWHANRDSPPFKSANDRVDSLTDLVHGSGTLVW